MWTCFIAIQWLHCNGTKALKIIISHWWRHDLDYNCYSGVDPRNKFIFQAETAVPPQAIIAISLFVFFFCLSAIFLAPFPLRLILLPFYCISQDPQLPNFTFNGNEIMVEQTFDWIYNLPTIQKPKWTWGCIPPPHLF